TCRASSSSARDSGACGTGYLDSAQRLGTPTERRMVRAFVVAAVLWRPSPLRFARHPAPHAPHNRWRTNRFETYVVSGFSRTRIGCSPAPFAAAAARNRGTRRERLQTDCWFRILAKSRLPGYLRTPVSKSRTGECETDMGRGCLTRRGADAQPSVLRCRRGGIFH